MGSNGGLWVVGDVITGDRSNWKGNISQDATPSSAFAGQVWSNTSYSPSTLTVYGSDSKWYPATVLRMGGDRIAAQSNTYAGMQSFCTVTASSYTAGKLYIRNESNAAWKTGIDPDKFSLGLVYTIGDDLLHSHDAEANGNVDDANYNLVKTITLDTLFVSPATIRIKFDLKTSNGANTAYGRIYKGGSPLGTERSTTSTGYTTYSEDLSYAAGNTLQLYVKIGAGMAGQYPTVRNFRVYGSETEPTLGSAIVNGSISADAFSATNS